MTNFSDFAAVQKIEIGENNHQQRIDNFLKKILKGVPTSRIYKIIRDGQIRINGKRCQAETKLICGDFVRIPPLRISQNLQNSRNLQNIHKKIPILFEDDNLIVVDKPSGMAVHGGSGVSFGVIELLRHQRPEAKFLELAHRLDKETSGILLIAKKKKYLNFLHEIFKNKFGNLVEKIYLLIVKGEFVNEVQKINFPLYKFIDSNGERRVKVDFDQGKQAQTIVKLLARWQDFSLLQAKIITGRTHQIRVHLSHLGFPILGDEKYGDFALNKSLTEKLNRMALHSWKLKLPKHYDNDNDSANDSDADDNFLNFESEIPTKFKNFIQNLGEPKKSLINLNQFKNFYLT